MLFKQLASAAALATIAATSAYSADSDVLPKENAEFTNWGEVEGWTIFVDQSRGTCLIERVDANENVVQMGLTASHEFGYFGVFTKADVKPKDNKVHLLLDDKAYYGDTNAKTKNLAQGYKGGYILANNPNFVEDVMKKYTMTVYPDDANSFEVSLDGTLKAIEEARKCNAEQPS
jgi:hypothetical protein